MPKPTLFFFTPDLPHVLGNPDSFAGMTEKGAAFIAENYSEERESIVSCWNQILC